jgi:hypothetical protein
MASRHIVSRRSLQDKFGSDNHGFTTFGQTVRVEPHSKEATLMRFLVKVSAGSAAANRSALVPPAPHAPAITVQRWRAHRNVVMAMAALFILTACVKQPPTPDTCVVPQESGFIGAGNKQDRMTMMQNGKPCEMFIMNNKGAVGVGKIVAPATHGVASLRFVYEATVLSYTPAHDFVGSDRFTVAFGSNVVETVEIQIVPSSAKP